MNDLNLPGRIVNLGRLIPALRDAVSRFAPSCLCALVNATMSLLMFHDIGDQDIVERLFAISALGLIALTSVKLAAESRHWSTAVYSGVAVVVLAIITGLVYLVFEPFPFGSGYYIFAVALIFSLLFAPYTGRHSDNRSVWYFNYRTGVAVFFGNCSALILGAGSSLGVISLGYLFDLEIPGKVYVYIWIFCGSLLLPFYILSNIAKAFDDEAAFRDFPKGIRFVVNFILVPLLLGYMAILYAYFFKIIVEWQLPRGDLGGMIVAFGTLGITTMLVAYPIRDIGTRLLALLYRYYYFVLVVPILLLAVAIGTRIDEYGVTEPRYVVAMMGVWFFAVTCLAIWKQERFEIRYVPMILAVLMLLASFGPWGAVEMSFSSQLGRFESMLTKHRMLVDGQAVKTNVELPFEDRRTLSSMLTFFIKHQQQWHRVEPLLPRSEDGYRLDNVTEIAASLGFEYVSARESEEIYSGRFTLFHPDIRARRGVNISGYSHYWPGGNISVDQGETIINFVDDGQPATLHLSMDSEAVNVTLGAETVRFDLNQQLAVLQEDHSRDNFIMVSETDRLKVRLLINAITGETTGDNETSVYAIGYGLAWTLND